MIPLTSQQSAAVQAPGNLLLVAGAGTGKTHTLTARCLRLVLENRVSITNLLLVTFTEAAAAEMLERLRQGLQAAAEPTTGRSAGLRPGAHGVTHPTPEASGEGRSPHSVSDASSPDHAGWIAEQLALLDTANIGTLHRFCLRLAREHFHQLGLDPQFTVLDETQTRPLQRAALDALLERHYVGTNDLSAAARELVRTVGRGNDQAVRSLVLRLHAFAQSLPDPAAWLADQAQRLSVAEPAEWRQQFALATARCRDNWLRPIARVRDATPALRQLTAILHALPVAPDYATAVETVRALLAADVPENWPHGTKGKFRDPLEKFLDEVQFLGHLLPAADHDPLAEDWQWARGPMRTLLELTREFTAEFTARKRELGGVDFADLEQCALRLLRDPQLAAEWRKRFAHVFVDEYQDINAAQDALLTALSRPGAAGNRFLVGDVKQSIYRFRLANPRIFQNYETAWQSGGNPAPGLSPTHTASHGERDGVRGRSGEFTALASTAAERVAAGDTTLPPGQALALTENFRSREAILDFVNHLFSALFLPELGAVRFDPLIFGAPAQRTSLRADGPRVELHLIANAPSAETGEDDDAPNAPPDLQSIEREARLIAQRFHQLHAERHQVWDKHIHTLRDVTWSDMAVLLRSPRGRAETFAMEFHRLGIPLHAARDGFFASLEVSDLLNLLRLLDNPLQDIPLAAVLRSPLVGLTLDELLAVRLTEPTELLWIAVNCAARTRKVSPPLRARLAEFLDQFQRWRELVRHTSLSQTLETALRDTHYEPLLLAEPRGAERFANVRRLLDLARQFDPYQRQGLYRFLRFVRTQEDEDLDLEPALVPAADAVRLLSVHRSKGLEFPVVALACLGTRFNEQDHHAPVLLDEQLGLCPKITPPGADQSYASLAHRLARDHARRELRAEELRLLYVALTRARDTLILTATVKTTSDKVPWSAEPGAQLEPGDILAARSPWDWLRLWMPTAIHDTDWADDARGGNALLTWEIIPTNDDRFRHPPGPRATPDPAQQPAPPQPLGSVTAAPPPTDAFAVVRARLEWQYPWAAATREAAKTSVTALRRRAADETDDEAKARFRFPSPLMTEHDARRARSDTPCLSAAEVGIAHHTFQQFVEVARTATELDLRNQAEALRAAGLLTEDQYRALHFANLAAFWQSPLGEQLRRVPAKTINREMEFTARLTAADAAALPTLALPPESLCDDFLVVQGQVDLAVLLPDQIWLLDFKTDHVGDDAELSAKTACYEPQLRIYARALAGIYRRPVTQCWLHFLTARRTVPVAPP